MWVTASDLGTSLKIQCADSGYRQVCKKEYDDYTEILTIKLTDNGGCPESFGGKIVRAVSPNIDQSGRTMSKAIQAQALPITTYFRCEISNSDYTEPEGADSES